MEDAATALLPACHAALGSTDRGRCGAAGGQGTDPTLRLSRRLRRLPILAAAGVATVLAATGLAVGWATSGQTTDVARAAVGELEVQIPAGWRRLESQPSVDGLSFSRALGLAPTTEVPPRSWRGISQALPRSGFSTVASSCDLGEHEAYRFRRRAGRSST